MIQIDTWTNCYDLGWGDLLVPAAYSHPAKMSRSLVFKIVEHALEEGWILPGQIVLDPFGGVGTTALPSLLAGLNYIGCELEPRFVELGRQNIALWNQRFSGMPKWTGQATFLAGDSRRLAEVVRAAGVVVGSPPYAEIRMDGGKIAKEGQGGMAPYSGESVDAWRTTRDQRNLGNLPPGTPPTPSSFILHPSALISSPPFAGNSGGRGEASRNGIDAALFDRHSGGMKKGTGSDPANLDHLPMGTLPMAIVSSPPYADQPTKNGGKLTQWEGKRRIGASQNGNEGYGGAPGQLGGMKAGAVISSPPFEKTVMHDGGPALQQGGELYSAYGSTAGQIGATQGDTFWAAARLIVEQCALLLPPGGAAIWVVKNYVKGGVEVQFSEQWQALCEACGFETVHVHRAMLVKNQGHQKFMLGGIWVEKKVERKSFFRRLAEKKGSPPIDFETVLCMRKAA